MKTNFFLFALGTLTLSVLSASHAFADAAAFEAECRGKIVNIEAVPGAGVLYKPENVHGGRGPSLIIQNKSQQTGLQTVQLRNARCETVATLGLFDPGHPPYGARYYSRTGGTGADSNELLRLANEAGSNNLLIQGVNGTWMRIKNPQDRAGSVNK